VVSALVPKERVQAFESERFVERAFEGSLPQFLVSFLGGRTISEQEAEELKRLIDAHRGS
jgi:predicted transcriptional regulator